MHAFVSHTSDPDAAANMGEAEALLADEADRDAGLEVWDYGADGRLVPREGQLSMHRASFL
jgi:hypothetical protein